MSGTQSQVQENEGEWNSEMVVEQGLLCPDGDIGMGW